MTDDEGNLVWFGNYTGWGSLKKMSGFIYKSSIIALV